MANGAAAAGTVAEAPNALLVGTVAGSTDNERYSFNVTVNPIGRKRKASWGRVKEKSAVEEEVASVAHGSDIGHSLRED